jgi:hypothetical protein
MSLAPLARLRMARRACFPPEPLDLAFQLTALAGGTTNRRAQVRQPLLTTAPSQFDFSKQPTGRESRFFSFLLAFEGKTGQAYRF